MRTQRTIDKLFEESDMDTNSNGILAALSRAKTTIPLTTTPLPTFIGAASSAPTPTTTTKGGETTIEVGSSPDRFSSGGILPIAVETLLPSPPPLQQMGPVEITANLNSTNNSGTSSSSSSSSDQLSSSSDSSYSLSSSYADDHAAGLDKFMLTSELNNAHASTTDSVVKSDHSYFKVLDPSTDIEENGEQSKRKKGRPRKYNVVSPSTSKTQAKLSHFTNNKGTAKSDSPSVSKSKTINRTLTRNPPAKYVRRNINCNTCENCLKLDCGKCKNCLDKPKFGGRNTKRQRCVERICLRRESCDGKRSSSIPAPNKATPSKSSLTYSARKRSLSQVTTTPNDKTTTPQPKPIKTPKLAITPTKLSTSTTVVSSANSKVTMTTSEKKEYTTRTSARRENSVPKVEEEAELEFLLSTAPRTLRKQLAINMALPTKSTKDSPRKGSSPAPEETPSSTRKSLRSSTLAATMKSINKANNPTTTASSVIPSSTTTSTTVTTTTKSPSTKDMSPKPTIADPPPKSSPGQNKEQSDSSNTAQVSSELAASLPSNLPSDSTIIVVPSLQDGVPMEQWTIANVAKFLTEIKYQQYITIFQHQEIDGQALVLLEVRDMVQTLNMKLGPALKLHRIIGLLKQK